VQLGFELVCLLVALVIRPTSLKRGEGLPGCWMHVIGAGLKWQGRRWWWWDERRWTKVNRDVDSGLKLCLPTKIAFNMNTALCDNEIKIWIVLRVF